VLFRSLTPTILCNATSSTSALSRFDFGGLVSRRLHDLRSLFWRLTHKAPRLRLQFNDPVSRGFQDLRRLFSGFSQNALRDLIARFSPFSGLIQNALRLVLR